MLKISEKEYEVLADYVLINYGIKLGESKKSLVAGRLQNIILQKGFRNFSEYFEYVFSDRTGNAAAVLMNKITTNHTFFMREPEHFHYFREKILPGFENTVRNRDLRIWSAGCSTGEEAYTLAMIMRDFFKDHKALWDTKVLATDISERVLENAKKGIYKNNDIGILPDEWVSGYFKKLDGEKSVVSEKIKNEVIFRNFNLNNPRFPFKRKFHVIFCRNVMIYFDFQAKKSLINRFYDFMEDGGYLLIGHSESLGDENIKFRYEAPSVYRK
jgi:chemotaxis protein methyltransferase CheR